MKPKKGSAVSVVKPTEPEEVFEADDAKPGKVAEVKTEQLKSKTGKYGSTKAPAFKPAKKETTDKSADKKEEKKAWIEVKLVDEDDKPVPGEKYKIELPDGKVASGTLNAKGMVKIEGIEPGNCKVSFPNFHKDAWSK